MTGDDEVDQEPSLLDYLKARLKFWEPGPKPGLLPPRYEEPQSEGKVAKVVSQEPTGDARQETIKSQLPWVALSALFLALLAQRSFEPSPDRTALPGLVLYALATVLLILAYRNKEWFLTPSQPIGAEVDPLVIRPVQLIIGIILAVLAFMTLGGNLFTTLNVTLWVSAVIFFVWALWLPDPSRPSHWSRLKKTFTQSDWLIKITPWSLLIVLVIIVVIFFRVYNLQGVPSEPFSDHAEKILDVYDVSQGQTHIFFPRNTGREAIQMYLTLAVAWIFQTGLTFISLKIGTVFCGLATLPYLYLLGKEVGGKRVGLLAVFFAGIAYWPNVISRVGLRFPLYPLFVAPTLYYLLRGLRRRSRNDFIAAGLFLGLGLHGYSPFRIMPIVVLIAVGLYLLHAQSKGNRGRAIIWLSILTLISIIVFLPLARYWLENPGLFSYRAFSRLGNVETPLPAPAWSIFLSNTWNALKMFNWSDGEIWVHSIPYRPALDIASGALFLLGAILVFIRYLRQRNWQDLFLLLLVPLLQLPSILSLAYPGENPALNRAAGAMVPVFLLVALSLDGILTGISQRVNARLALQQREGTQGGTHKMAAPGWILVILLGGMSLTQNYDLVFNQYNHQFTAGAWNSSEMGAIIKEFGSTSGSTQNVWIVPYPNWVDTRLPGVWAGIPNRDFAIFPEDFSSTLDVQGAKLFMVNVDDKPAMEQLADMYPEGSWNRFDSATDLDGKDFMIFFIPAGQHDPAAAREAIEAP